jgi:hypothetical protein
MYLLACSEIVLRHTCNVPLPYSRLVAIGKLVGEWNEGRMFLYHLMKS